MDEVREFERRIQEATNQKIGMFPPSISIGETPLSSLAPTGPASAPSTPLYTDAPEFLSVPKERPRKKSAPETLTLPEPGQSVPVPAPNHASLSPASSQTEWLDLYHTLLVTSSFNQDFVNTVQSLGSFQLCSVLRISKRLQFLTM